MIRLDELEAKANGVRNSGTFYNSVVEWCSSETADNVLALIRVARCAGACIEADWVSEELKEAMKEFVK
jgi:hypothetical protein